MRERILSYSNSSARNEFSVRIVRPIHIMLIISFDVDATASQISKVLIESVGCD